MNKVKKIFAVIFAIMAVMLMSTAVWAEVISGSCYDFDTETGVLTLKGTIDRNIGEFSKYSDVVEIKCDTDAVLPAICSYMFTPYKNCKKISFSSANADNVRYMGYMFSTCNSLETIDFGNISTRNVTNMNSMFYKCEALQTLDLSNFDTGKVTDMSEMFSLCLALKALDISNFDTSNVTNMKYMFNYCQVLESIDVSKFNTSKVTNMYGMFNSCREVSALDVSGFDTSNVTDMHSMFHDCYNIKCLELGNFDTSNVTDMAYMMAGCYKLESIDISSFDTSNVTDMTVMFYGCKLTELDLSHFNTDKVTYMNGMFGNCSKLKFLDMSNFNTTNVTEENSENMFEASYELYKIILGPNFKEIKESMKLGNMRNGWRNINNYSVKLSNGYYAVFTNIGLNAYTNNLISTISFYKGEGSGTMPTAYEATGFEYKLPECGFTAPSGYTFDGWELNGTKYSAGDKVIVSEDIRLIAKWQKDYYIVNFNANGGSGNMGKINVEKGSELILPECGFNSPTDGHYYFNGWLIDDVLYSAGATITPTSNITVSAQWQKYHFVKYYSDNNATQIKQNVINDGITTSLLAYENCNFTKPAYKDFDHWEIDGEEYKPGDKITVTKDTNVYAAYKDRLYAVSFDTAGLCTPPETQYIAYGGTVSDPGIPFAKGYTFVAWYSDSSFNDVYRVSDFGSPIHAVNGDTVYYACFKEAVGDYVEVTGFDINIHSGMNYYTKDILSVPDGANYQIVRINWYAFEGSWNNSLWDDGRVSFTAGKDYYAEITILPNSGLTFGSGTINDKLVSLNDGQSLIDFDNSTFGSYSIYLRTKPVTALDSCEVSFMANGGTGNMDDVKVAQGTKFILPECAFTAPEGKYFVGWARSKYGFEFDPVGDTIDAGEEVTLTANNMFFFAQWADKGDVNADGKITDADAALVLKFISGTTTLTSGQLEMAKMNGDDVVDMLDVIAILNNKTA